MIHPRRLLLSRVLLAILLAALVYQPREASAHESRPALLQINEITADRYDVIWRAPLLSGMRLPVVLRLPGGVHDIGRDFACAQFADETGQLTKNHGLSIA